MTKSEAAAAAAAATPLHASSCSLSYDHDEKKDQKEKHHQQQQHHEHHHEHHQQKHQHHAASSTVVESADVRQARKGLLKVMLEHNLMPKFSSTPVLLRDDDDDAADMMPAVERTVDQQQQQQQHNTSITASERDYLESLLQSGDAQRLRAASDRLQDVTLFPKEQQQQQHQHTNDDLSSTELSTDAVPTFKNNTNNNKQRCRRDSQVQQQLFKLHEQGAGVHNQRPSVVLQRMHDKWLHHTNSILLVDNEESSYSFDDSNSIVDFATAQTAATSLSSSNTRTTTTSRPRHSRQQQQPQRMNSILACDPNNSILESTGSTMDEMETKPLDAAVADADDFLALDEQEEEEEAGGSKGIGMGLFVGRQKVASRPIISYRQQNSILASDNDNATIASTASTTAFIAEHDENENEDENGASAATAAAATTPSCLMTLDGVDNGGANVTKAATEGSGTLRTTSVMASAGTTTTTGPSSASSSGTFRILGTWADDVSCHPHVLSPPLMESLLAFIPESMADYNYYLKYSLVRDGGGISTLLRHARASNTTILAIETTEGHVFGSFTGVGWRLSRGWYGSSEAFLWKMRRSRLEPSSSSSSTTGRQQRRRSIVQQAMQESEIQVFPFRPGNVAVQYCSKECIMLGQGELLVMRNSNNNAAAPTTAVAHATPSAAAAAIGGVGVATSVSALPPTEHASSRHSSTRKSDKEGTATTTTTAESATTAGHGSKHYGHGLYLQADLLGGSTSTSETFGNPCLVNDTLRGARFKVENLEVWTLTPHDTLEQAQESELSSLFLEGDDYPKKDLNLLGILVGGSIS